MGRMSLRIGASEARFQAVGMVHGSLEVALIKDIDNKNSLLRSSTNPQDYYDPSIAFGLPPLGLDWMGSRRQ